MSKSVVYNSSITVVRQVLGIIIGMLSAMIIARVLGVEGQGRYALVILLPNVLYTVFNMGVAPATVYYIGKKEFSLADVFRTNLFLALGLSLATILIGILFLVFFHEKFYASVSLQAIYMILCVLPFLFLNKNLQVLFQGKEQFEKFNIVVILNQVGLLLFSSFFLLVLDLDLFGALLAFVLTQVFMLLGVLYFLKTEFQLKLNSGSISFDYLKGSVVYGLKGHLSNILAFINYRIDLFIIAYFLNDVAVGLYSIAVSIAERIWIVSQSVSSVLFARVSNLNSDTERAQFTALVSRNVLFLSIIGGFGLFLLGKWIIFLLFGANYAGSTAPFLWLIPGIVLGSMSRIISNYFSGIGRPEINTYVAVFLTILNVGLNIVLVPKYGVVGAAIATTVTYSMNMVVKTVIFSCINNMSWTTFVIIKISDFDIYKGYIAKILK